MFRFIFGIYKQILKIYFYIKPYLGLIMRSLHRRINVDPYEIPIIINNRNRLLFLKQQIAALESRGYTNICIIDNNSTYPPLLEYYEKECLYKIYRLNRNFGHLALWRSGLIKRFRKQYFVYTDPDIVPIEECPADFMVKFLDIMEQYPLLEKVGFALEIDNLPNSFNKKNQVVNWEKQFWENKIEGIPILYKAAIDTTFALYKPYYFLGGNLSSPHIRVGFPYMARHMPWYADSLHLMEEDIYYVEHCETLTHWTTGKLK